MPEYPQDDLSDVVIPDHPCPPGKNPAQAIAEISEIWGVEFADRVRGGSRAQYAQDQHDPCNLHWGNVPRAMLKSGMTLHSVAEELDEDIEVIIGHVVWLDVPTDVVLDVERQLRAGVFQLSDVYTGDWDIPDRNRWLHRFAKALGIKSELAERLEAGHGRKYTAEQKAEARRLRLTGMSLKDVAEQTGIAFKTCRSYDTRYGWYAELVEQRSAAEVAA